MDSDEPEQVRRRPWVAALLSLFFPGLGQLYCGELKRCLKFVGALAILAIIAEISFISTRDIRAAFVLWILGGWIVFIVGAIDAWRLAKRRNPFILCAYNRWYVYVVAAVSMSALMWIEETLVVQIDRFSNASHSMEPSMLKDETWAARMCNRGSCVPERGQVIVFEHPEEPGVDYVKRLIALPGETVQMVSGRLFINGDEVARKAVSASEEGLTRYRETLPNGCSYEIYEQSDDQEQDDTGLFVVPSDSVFVLGDNRDRSKDSRYEAMGPVTIGNIKGVAGFITWSKDIVRIGTQFQCLQN
ncbi:MAG: signal peptidase I [Rhodospirillales bacterium]